MLGIPLMIFPKPNAGGWNKNALGGKKIEKLIRGGGTPLLGTREYFHDCTG